MGKAMMKRLIRFVSVTSSKIGSQKAGGSKQEQLVEQVKQEMQELDPEQDISEGW